jgi:hypothetical protein
MATPLIEILQAVFRQGAPIDLASFREQGYEDIDAADMKEAMLAMAETAPVSESVVLTEVADGLEGDEGGLVDAVQALQSAREAYEGILEAQGDAVDIDGIEADVDTDGGDVDIDIDVSGADVEVSVDTGDADGEVTVEVMGDDDPSIDIEGDGLGDIMVTIDGEELDFDLEEAGSEDDGFGTDIGGEDVAPDTADDFELDFD